MQRIYTLLLAVICTLPVAAQQKKDLSPDDYGKWQTLAGSVLSPNGNWVAYGVAIQEDNDTVFVVNRDTKKRYTLEFASQPSFSKDNQWIAYAIGVPFKEAEKLRDQRQPIPTKMGLLNLVTGKKEMIKDVSSFRFSKNGKFIAISLTPPKENKDKGAVLLLRNLADSSTHTIGNVTSFDFNKKSDHLAYIVASANQAGNSVELLNLQTYALKVIASDTMTFSKLSWAKEGDGFVFYKTVKNDDYEEESAQIYVYAPLSRKPALKTFDPLKQTGFPKATRINPASALVLQDDLAAVYFGTQSWTAKPKKDTTTKKPVAADTTKIAKADSTKPKPAPIAAAPKDKPAAVDVWHWKDAEIQPRQKVTYGQDKERSYLSVWNIAGNSCYQLSADSISTVSSSAAHPFVMTYVEDKYKPAFKTDFADVYVLNSRTGERKMIGERFTSQYGHVPQISTAGKYVLFYKDKQWWTYNTTTAQSINITQNIPTKFENYRDDHPAVKPPWGNAGWTKNDKEILLYDEYDIYAVKPDGKGYRKLTNGTEKEIQHRIMRVEMEDPFLDDSKPLYISLYGDKSKFTGIAKLENGKVTQQLYEPLLFGRLIKAEDAPVFAYTRQDYDRSPELYTSNAFQGEEKIVSTNPQQQNYKWGRSELVSFTNKKGQKMQGALFYPADYQQGKQYPMIVYIYEILSNTVHGYIPPSRRGAYNTTNFTTNGYFVFRPDIVYEINDPGMSAVDCVVPAVEEVLKTGMIDKNKVGLMGHSWGAYQTSFIITQTDLFKAACAGAPLTNLISMSLAIYWNSGTPDQKIFETSQGRFDGPWYERMQEHMRNSPIYQAQHIKAPLLVAFGDKDGAVDWHQGIEMYGTMRRMEKPHVMLVYADENHGLAKKENQIDYQSRQREWFDHYLLGKPAPKWITEGVKYVDKMKEQEKANKP